MTGFVSRSARLDLAADPLDESELDDVVAGIVCPPGGCPAGGGEAQETPCLARLQPAAENILDFAWWSRNFGMEQLIVNHTVE